MSSKKPRRDIIAWQDELLFFVLQVDASGSRGGSCMDVSVRVSDSIGTSGTPLTDAGSSFLDDAILGALSAARDTHSRISFLAASYERAETCVDISGAPYSLQQRLHAAGLPREALITATAAIQRSVITYAVTLCVDGDPCDDGENGASGGGGGIGAQNDPVLQKNDPRVAPNSPAVGTMAHAALLDGIIASAGFALPGAPVPIRSAFIAALALAAAALPGDALARVFAPLVAECVARVAPPPEPPTGKQRMVNMGRWMPDTTMLADIAWAQGPIGGLPQYPAGNASLSATTISGGGGGGGGGGGLGSRATWPRASLARPDSFVPWLSALSRIFDIPEVASAAVAVPPTSSGRVGAATAAHTDPWGWGHSLLLTASPGAINYAPSSTPPIRPARVSSLSLETGTLLGRLASLGACRDDFTLPGGEDAILARAQINIAAAEATGDGGGGDNDGDEGGGLRGFGFRAGHGAAPDGSPPAPRGGVPLPATGFSTLSRLLPPRITASDVPSLRRAVDKAINSSLDSLRVGAAAHSPLYRGLIARLVRLRGGAGRDAVLFWAGRLIDAAAPRTTEAYTNIFDTPATASLASDATLAAAADALFSLCVPFMDPSCPISARIDPRYITSPDAPGGVGARNGSGGGRFNSSADTQQCPAVANWLDVRNASRQAQFADFQASRGVSGAVAARTVPLPASPPMIPPPSMRGGVEGTGIGGGRTLQPMASPPVSSLLASPPPPPPPPPSRAGGGLSARVNDGGAGGGNIAALVAPPSPAAALPLAQAITTSLPPLDTRRVSHPSSTATDLTLISDLAPIPTSWNPVTEFFWLTSALLHTFLLPALSRRDTMPRQVHDKSKLAANAARVLRESGIGASTSAAQWSALSDWDTNLTLLDDRSAKLASLEVRATDGKERGFLRDALLFYRLQAVFLLRCVAPEASNTVPGLCADTEHVLATGNTSGGSAPPPIALAVPVPTLPLPPPVSIFGSLPSWVLKDVAEVFWRTDQSNARETLFKLPDSVGIAPYGDLVTFAITFLASPAHVVNPYDRGSLVKLLECFIPRPHDQWRDPDIDAARIPMHHRVLIGHVSATRSMMPAIAGFYVDIASAGAHTTFYDKFEYRQSISQMIRWLCARDAAYRVSLDSLAETGDAGGISFARFANEVVNDADYVLGEALRNVADMHDVEVLRADTVAWAASEPSVRSDADSKYESAKQQVRSFLSLAREYLGLVACLTSGVTRPWVTPPLRDRVAGALGFYLDALVGAKRGSLHVRDAKALGFSPRSFLLELGAIYAALGGASGAAGAGFALAVVRDARSFHVENFEKALNFLTDSGAAELPVRRVSAVVPALRAILPLVIAAIADDAAGEAELGDLPDALQDPITNDLLRVPMLLPTSGNVMCREAIVRQLLNAEQDPFNRERLTETMLVPLPALSAFVDEWVAARRAGDLARAASALAASEKELERVRNEWAAERKASREREKEAARILPPPSPLSTPQVLPSPHMPLPSPVPFALAPAPIAGAGAADVEMLHGDDDSDTELSNALALSLSNEEALAASAAAANTTLHNNGVVPPPPPPPMMNAQMVGGDDDDDEEAALAEAMALSLSAMQDVVPHLTVPVTNAIDAATVAARVVEEQEDLASALRAAMDDE